jgi:hypothetical protein
VAEHPFGEIDRSRGATQRGGDDEAEDVKNNDDQMVEDVVAACRPVGMGVEGVQQ